MRIRGILQNERGAVAITTAVTMLGTIGLLSFVIDFGQVYYTQQELRNVADSAALAATRQMAQILKTKSTVVLQSSSFALSSAEIAQVTAAASNVAVKNKAGGKSIALVANSCRIRLSGVIMRAGSASSGPRAMMRSTR